MNGAPGMGELECPDFAVGKIAHLIDDETSYSRLKSYLPANHLRGRWSALTKILQSGANTVTFAAQLSCVRWTLYE